MTAPSAIVFNGSLVTQVTGLAISISEPGGRQQSRESGRTAALPKGRNLALDQDAVELQVETTKSGLGDGDGVDAALSPTASQCATLSPAATGAPSASA